jgi:NADPH:quinone reductase-like Zn-dependent oxidoreductase
MMHAAAVRSFDTPPSFEEFPAPAPADDDEVLVEVVASALHPRVRSQAGGSHYTSTDQLPLVPGIDGVGTGPAGEFVAELPELAGRISDGTFAIATRPVPLREVHATWTEAGDGRRIFFVP